MKLKFYDVITSDYGCPAIRNGIDVKWIYFFLFSQKIDEGTLLRVLYLSFVLMTREDMDIRSAEYSALHTHFLSFFFLDMSFACLSLFVTIRRVTALKAFFFHAVSWSKNIYVVSIMFVCVPPPGKKTTERKKLRERRTKTLEKWRLTF